MFNKRTRLCRYHRRYFSTIYSISFLIIFLISIRMYQHQFNIYDDDHQNRPEYCNQSIIQKFYMHDQSPRELFAQDPIRSSFTYKLSNKNFCSSSSHPPHALIFVISKSINFGIRNAIRRTWGNFQHINSIKKFSNLRLKLLFLLDIDETSLFTINLEQSIYHDLVQVYLPQHYILSTHRDMAILHWTETYCSKTLLTIKTDDDIFLNIFLLANFLNYIISNITIDLSQKECKSASNFDPHAIIYGTKIRHAKVIRYSKNFNSEESRYITTNDEYPCRYYPDYMSGFGYIITRNARIKLLCAFFREEKLFHLSDVYVTGILPEYMNILRQKLSFQISSRDTDDCDTFFNEGNAFACASALHYRNEPISSSRDIYISQRFNIYWQHVYHNRMQSIYHSIKY